MDVVHLRARVGMVFQKPNPFPKSIFENVAYGPRIHGLAKDKHELEQIVHESLQRAGPQGSAGSPAAAGNGLSGGQQQRLHRPRDRRAAGSHPDGRTVLGARPDRHRQIEELIDELRENYTIVIVTHSMQQAARVSQRTGFSTSESWWRRAPPK